MPPTDELRRDTPYCPTCGALASCLSTSPAKPTAPSGPRDALSRVRGGIQDVGDVLLRGTATG